MMSKTQIVVHSTADMLACAAAARLITTLVDAQQTRGTASVALTGGGVGIAMLRAIASSPARDAVDWGNVDIWWGDERFVPRADSERNERQAREALLDHVRINETRVHHFAASDELAVAELAAEQYATALDRAWLDVVLLGVGPDGHVASLFPEHPALHEGGLTAAVHGSPKPPPNRTTLTFSAINRAEEVWLIAAGEAKAAMIGAALSGAGPMQVPAAGVRGRTRTLWLLDRAAAAQVPAPLRTPF